MMLMACAGGLALTAVSAISPTYWWFVAIFALGRPLLSATSGVAQVTAAEETASSQRAKAVALIAAGYGIGSGLIAITHSLGASTLGFRGVVLLALVPLAALPFVARWVVEPDRFTIAAAAKDHPLPVLGAVGPRFRRRLAIVAGLTFAVSLVTGPANSFFFLYAQNVMRLSGAATALLIVGAGVTGLAGLLLGRLLADRVGRRIAAGGAMIAMALLGMVTYSGSRLAAGVGYLLAVLAASIFAPLRARSPTSCSRPRFGPRSPGGRSQSASSAQPSGCWPSAPSPMSATIRPGSCRRVRGHDPGRRSLRSPARDPRKGAGGSVDGRAVTACLGGVPFGALGRRSSSNFAPNLPPIEIATGRNLFPKQVHDKFRLSSAGEDVPTEPQPCRDQYEPAANVAARTIEKLRRCRPAVLQPPSRHLTGRQGAGHHQPEHRAHARRLARRRHHQAGGAPAHEGRGPGNPVSRSHHVVRERTEGRKRAPRAEGELPQLHGEGKQTGGQPGDRAQDRQVTRRRPVSHARLRSAAGRTCRNCTRREHDSRHREQQHTRPGVERGKRSFEPTAQGEQRQADSDRRRPNSPSSRTGPTGVARPVPPAQVPRRRMPAAS